MRGTSNLGDVTLEC